MKALLFERNLVRFGASRLASVVGSGRGAGLSPLRLADVDAPELPADDWFRVQPTLSGICGSDLATVDGRSSRYFEDIVSFPFVPGHEVVGHLSGAATLADGTTAESGARVVIEPVLGCAARAIAPRCSSCAQGHLGDCEHIAFGHLRPGLQTGFCADTGGGWSSAGLVAHSSQLHAVPETLSDHDAVMVEPLACALHSALAGGVEGGELVAVIGAGTLGLLTIAALGYLRRTAQMADPAAVLVAARYRHQRELAEAFGADQALEGDELIRAVRRASNSMSYGISGSTARLTGGADLVFDCVGSAESIAQALAMVRPRGKVVLVGMPSMTKIDLTPLWHREVQLVGAYAYGTEALVSPVRTFDLALAAAGELQIGRLVSATYPIDRFEEALAHAGGAGRRGAVKVAFDLRTTKGHA